MSFITMRGDILSSELCGQLELSSGHHMHMHLYTMDRCVPVHNKPAHMWTHTHKLKKVIITFICKNSCIVDVNLVQ